MGHAGMVEKLLTELGPGRYSLLFKLFMETSTPARETPVCRDVEQVMSLCGVQIYVIDACDRIMREAKTASEAAAAPGGVAVPMDVDSGDGKEGTEAGGVQMGQAQPAVVESKAQKEHRKQQYLAHICSLLQPILTVSDRDGVMGHVICNLQQVCRKGLFR